MPLNSDDILMAYVQRRATKDPHDATEMRSCKVCDYDQLLVFGNEEWTHTLTVCLNRQRNQDDEDAMQARADAAFEDYLEDRDLED